MKANYHINLNSLWSQATPLEVRKNWKIDIYLLYSMLIVYSYTLIILYRLLDTIRYSYLYNILTIFPSYLMWIESWIKLYLVWKCYYSYLTISKSWVVISDFSLNWMQYRICQLYLSNFQHSILASDNIIKGIPRNWVHRPTMYVDIPW